MIVTYNGRSRGVTGLKAIVKQDQEKSGKPEYNVIPVQLSESEFTEFILQHVSQPKRGPECKICYHHAFNLILKWHPMERMLIERNAEGTNYGHGQQGLSLVFYLLNLLASVAHLVLKLGNRQYQQARQQETH